MSAKHNHAAWARPIKKVYEADPEGGSRSKTCESPLSCPRCHNPMKVIAVITDPVQVLKILRHLIKTGKLSGDSGAKHCESPPPGLDPASLN